MGTYQGPWGFLTGLVTEPKTHDFTSFSTVTQVTGEHIGVGQRSGSPALGILQTLRTQDSIPFPSKSMHIPNNSTHPGKSEHMSVLLSSLTRGLISRELTHSFLIQGKQCLLTCFPSQSWDLQIFIIGTWNLFLEAEALSTGEKHPLNL